MSLLFVGGAPRVEATRPTNVRGVGGVVRGQIKVDLWTIGSRRRSWLVFL
jgi:hypothetical protein